MKTGIELIAEERARQVSVEGWTPEHDDKHDDGDLVRAGAGYALCAAEQAAGWRGGIAAPAFWPPGWRFKPKDQVSNLVRGGALIAAEIDRLQRAIDGRHRSLVMKTLNFTHQDGESSITVPDGWPMDACAEVAAFRCGFEPGDQWRFREIDGRLNLISVAGNV